MRYAYPLFCLAAFACVTAPALSADRFFELTEVSGKVLVTTKDGALPATLGQQVPQGARIFVGDGAIARVSSTDGICNATLPDNKVTVVNYKKLCDVKITPTSTTSYVGGVRPPFVGVSFFALAGAVVGVSTLTNEKPASTP
jgi:hypothetical protein